MVGLGVFCFSYFSLFYKNSSCLRIPLVKFSKFGIPIIQAEIEGMSCFLEVDLGLVRQLRLYKETIEKIKNKKKKDNVTSVDISGNFYEVESFQIPSIRFKNWEIKDVTLSEESHVFTSNIVSGFPSEEIKRKFLEEDAKDREGAVGWPIFAQFVSFFDLGHAKIVLGKDITSLRNAGYLRNGFIEVPFSTDRGGIILSVTTDLGTRSFLLDTGSVYSMIKQNLILKESVLEIQPNIPVYVSRSFLLNEYDLGSWTFRLWNISDFYDQFDGVLGMDFFRKHAICLDFQNKTAYIQAVEHHAIVD